MANSRDGPYHIGKRRFCMRKINTITKYEVEHGDSVHMNPLLIKWAIIDSGIEAQSFGDADFEEDGLYEFDKDEFSELVDWLAEQDDEYFVQYLNYTAASDLAGCKTEVLHAFRTILEANKNDIGTVRIEIY